ncbi:hypothetical protein DVA86_15365 [Streptomyces armeniacus]|uniref:Uncharacterized protein n=1 Tax=Streptomyces armeniacus TaxID=83291 RepID=A0A345XQB6_9ACTN|nr:hypothetical protein [Streptomyces armeniacus]AXK33832.1 hypothetical protein DVA86_15365 [Streptomyces armeniacus]
MANHHASFRRSPYPDGTLYSDSHARQLADLHTSLHACASSYLSGLGHLDGPSRETLAETIHGIRRHMRPGYAPLNGYLAAWLRFANLLEYATDTRLDH